MSTRICLRLGLVSGAFVGALLSLLHDYTSCCGAPVFPATFWRLALDGMVVALIVMFVAACFTCLVTHLPITPVFLLAFYIAIITGFLLANRWRRISHSQCRLGALLVRICRSDPGLAAVPHVVRQSGERPGTSGGEIMGATPPPCGALTKPAPFPRSLTGSSCGRPHCWRKLKLWVATHGVPIIRRHLIIFRPLQPPSACWPASAAGPMPS